MKALVRLVSRIRCHSGERVLLGLLADIGAGIVDQDVEPAELGERGLHERPAGRFASDLDLDRERPRTVGLELRHGLRALVAVARRDHHRRAGLCQAARHTEPNTAVAAGDDRDLAAQIEQRHCASSASTSAAFRSRRGCPPQSHRNSSISNLVRRHLNIRQPSHAHDQVVQLRTILLIEIVSFALLDGIGMIRVATG
jgi:hypothetical protein